MGTVRGHSRQGGSSEGGTAPSPSKQPVPQWSCRPNTPNTVFQRWGLKPQDPRLLCLASAPQERLLWATAVHSSGLRERVVHSFWVRQ